MDNSANFRINFVSSKDFTETLTMHSNSDNIETSGSETAEIIEELFESLVKKISRKIRRESERK